LQRSYVAGGYGGILLNARDRLGQLAGLALFYGPDKTMTLEKLVAEARLPRRQKVDGFTASNPRGWNLPGEADRLSDFSCSFAQ